MTLSDAREEARNDAAREAEFKRDCREAAAELANDMQAVMAQVEEIALKWAERGWLNQTERRNVGYDNIARLHQFETVTLPPLAAASRLATIIKQDMEDALSLTAQEALEVSQ